MAALEERPSVFLEPLFKFGDSAVGKKFFVVVGAKRRRVGTTSIRKNQARFFSSKSAKPYEFQSKPYAGNRISELSG
jgi:hypothetical protein